jgi:hypothetical protein
VVMWPTLSRIVAIPRDGTRARSFRNGKGNYTIASQSGELPDGKSRVRNYSRTGFFQYLHKTEILHETVLTVCSGVLWPKVWTVVAGALLIVQPGVGRSTAESLTFQKEQCYE